MFILQISIVYYRGITRTLNPSFRLYFTYISPQTKGGEISQNPSATQVQQVQFVLYHSSAIQVQNQVQSPF